MVDSNNDDDNGGSVMLFQPLAKPFMLPSTTITKQRNSNSSQQKGHICERFTLPLVRIVKYLDYLNHYII